MNAEQISKTLQDCGLDENEQKIVKKRIVAGTIKTDYWGLVNNAELAEILKEHIAGTNTIVLISL